jgi:UDPglucose 6-dehydrogenase
MKICVFGLRHLGSVTAACAAAAGVATVGLDPDASVVAKLRQGQAPLSEPGLDALIAEGLAKGTLAFSADLTVAVDCDVVWVCFDTPVDAEDRADVDFVVNQVASVLPHLKRDAVVLVSSQLPVGTLAALEERASRIVAGRRISFACSPENLRLGTAIAAFRGQARIAVGVRDQRTRGVLEPLLSRFCETLLWMSVESAEMVKHAVNAFLAVSITFTNELAQLCEQSGADAAEVELALRSEPRIGRQAYVRAGPAIGGGTLLRDVRFLEGLARGEGIDVPLLAGVWPSNDAHRDWALRQLRHAGALAGRTIGVLGLAYKPGTDALRRSGAVALCRALLGDGARLRAFDPAVRALPAELDAVTLAVDAESVAEGADAVVLATEWPEFRALTPAVLASRMNAGVQGRLILDAGRFLDAAAFAADERFVYRSVGRASGGQP